jgi:acylphosphatase
MVEIQAIISGKVQAVAYRAYVQDVASQLGVVGYIQNLQDGSVEIVAQAEPSILKELVEYLHEGSLLSKVEGVAVEWRSAKSSHEDFSIRF